MFFRKKNYCPERELHSTFHYTIRRKKSQGRNPKAFFANFEIFSRLVKLKKHTVLNSFPDWYIEKTLIFVQKRGSRDFGGKKVKEQIFMYYVTRARDNT